MPPKSTPIYMSGFLRTVTDLGQNFFACLSTIAGREAFAVLEKGGSIKEGWGRQLRCLATSWYQGEGPEFIPWGWGGSQREALCSAKLLILFAAQPLAVMPCRLSVWKPASQTQGRWVSKLCVERLSMAD